MSASSLPAINALLEVSIDGAMYPSRVEDVDGDFLTVAAPLGMSAANRPRVGAAVEVFWLDGGRLVAPARLTAVTHEHPPRWTVRVVGGARHQTRRAYMRGGGGESIRLSRVDGEPTPVIGRVVDLSEGSVRCRIPAVDYQPGEALDIAVRLGEILVEQRVRVLFGTRDQASGDLDLVATFTCGEAIGRVIRAYILRRQLAERRRMADST